MSHRESPHRGCSGGRLIGMLLLLGPVAAVAAAEPALPTRLPGGFESVIFAAPPLINYPAFLCPGEAGELFVSVDKNASLDTKPDRGFIIKLIDSDGDGAADRRVEFAKVTSPRGLAYDGEWLYCLHPPSLTRFRDGDGDGVAEDSQRLVSGIGFDLSERPPDHTSNGVTLALDGWLYLAIGDFGFLKAKGTDGRTLQLHGGGVVRVRPDGSRLELFCRGTRNTYEVAVDPWLNVFARDNTNDGGGWDIKVHALFFGAEMGYPVLFRNFPDETMPTLGVYGGGSGAGATYIHEPAIPEPFGSMLFTADWGRNAIYYHPRKGEKGAWFDLGQETFCEIQRPTDIKADAAGNIYIASWQGGEYTYKGENVGYIALVHSPEAKRKAGSPRLPRLPAPPPRDVTGLTEEESAPTPDEKEVYAALTSRSLTTALMAQHHVLRTRSFVYRARGAAPEIDDPDAGPAWIALELGRDPNAVARIARNLEGAPESAAAEFHLRALGDFPDLAAAADVPTPALVAALSEGRSDRVKTQAVIALSRLGRKESAPALLAVAAQAPPAADDGALAVEPRAATANVKGTAATRVQPLTADITGVRKLFLVVTDGGDGMNGDHADWIEPVLVGAGEERKLTDLTWLSASAGWNEPRVGRSATGEPMRIDGREAGWGIGTHAPSVIAYDLPADHGWTTLKVAVGLDDSTVRQNARAGSVQFHVYADTLPPEFRGAGGRAEDEATDWRRSLPHLASRALIALEAGDVCLAALDEAAAEAGEDFGPRHAAALRVLRNLHHPGVVSGLIDRLTATAEGALQRGILTALIRLRDLEAEWDGRSWGTRPDTRGPYFRKSTWSETGRIDKAIRDHLARSSEPAQRFVNRQLQRHRVILAGVAADAPKIDPQWARDQEMLAAALARAAAVKPGAIGTLDTAVAVERTLAALASGTPDRRHGEQLFTEQGCAACHAVRKDAPPKGPNLFDIAKRYQPAEILTSVLNPSATVAQGFPTAVVETMDGQTHSGFVVRESGDEVVLRNMAAVTEVIPTGAIKSRRNEDGISSMTPGLVNNLRPEDLASLLGYLRSLE